MFKANIRIPTAHQYAFIELQVEDTPEKIKACYDIMTEMMNKSQAMSEIAFNVYLVNVINSDISDWKGVSTDEYHSLTDSQKAVIQAIKRFKKRLPKDE